MLSEYFQLAKKESYSLLNECECADYEYSTCDYCQPSNYEIITCELPDEVTIKDIEKGTWKTWTIVPKINQTKLILELLELKRVFHDFILGRQHFSFCVNEEIDNSN